MDVARICNGVMMTFVEGFQTIYRALFVLCLIMKLAI